jgi:hypothetical protein
MGEAERGHRQRGRLAEAGRRRGSLIAYAPADRWGEPPDVLGAQVEEIRAPLRGEVPDDDDPRVV